MKHAQRVAVVTCVATLVLIAVGAYVRASGSGLGCPDWPTCEGTTVLPTNRASAIELTHRYIASLVGLLVVTQAVLAWRFYRHAPVVFWGAVLLVPLVGIQGMLGAITVWRELPPEIVATHLVTAMVVLSFMATVTVGMFLEDPSRRTALSAAARRAARGLALRAVVAIAVLATLVWIGGYITKSGAAWACPDWPTCEGLRVVPAKDSKEITHMAHRYIAAGIALVLLPVVVSAWRHRHALWWAGPVALGVAGLYGAQIGVGALNVWFEFPEPLTVAHTALAAGIWFLLSSAAAIGYYAPVGERGAVVRASEVPA